MGWVGVRRALRRAAPSRGPRIWKIGGVSAAVAGLVVVSSIAGALVSLRSSGGGTASVGANPTLVPFAGVATPQQASQLESPTPGYAAVPPTQAPTGSSAPSPTPFVYASPAPWAPPSSSAIRPPSSSPSPSAVRSPSPSPSAVRSASPSPSLTAVRSPSPSPGVAASLCGAPSNPWGYNFCSRGGLIYRPPSNFCSYFTPCVSTFWTAPSGYVVQCVDRKWSHSGGVADACTTDGGVSRNLYSGP
jgi:hypothetical protein